MATPFSWTDTIQIAFGSCLPCLKPAVNLGEDDSGLHQEHNPAINRIQRARPDELQGLLADPDTDVEAETLSLHSNPGSSAQRNRNKKKRRAKLKAASSKDSRRITLFGYDLFGRGSSAAVQLPDDGVDALYVNEPRQQWRVRSGSLTPTTILTAHSTATFDSDAAPLDADDIAAMSSPTVAASAAAKAAEAEAQRLREKEERRQRRRERKEGKRLAEALASGEGDAFEGFQGSGGDYAAPPHSRPTSDSGSGSVFSGSTQEQFGNFVSAVQQQYPQHDEDDDAADLDGSMYASKRRRGLPPSRLNGGSDSQSRTSASDKSHQLPDARHALAHIQSHSFGIAGSRVHSPSQLQFSNSASASSDGGQARKSKRKASNSSRTTRSHSSAGTSQSPSIPSPVSPSFAAPQAVVSPSTIEQGQGFFDLEDERPIRKDSLSVHEPPQSPAKFPTTRIGGGGGGFPSTGFGGASSTRAKDFGAFLAHRGDDDLPADGL
ncbi:hypothetical protein D9619_010986 [Psilocybe cf. subviscida]|uniref:Uncharacterized protein n=1 Tax=Psilocybe cf. subviscida TaxID=2480587 RepID=A0A8H5B8X8_9AGAR|nr:hypothetical protein D9619_010986 [Psilocybe cf. subviscida]